MVLTTAVRVSADRGIGSSEAGPHSGPYAIGHSGDTILGIPGAFRGGIPEHSGAFREHSGIPGHSGDTILIFLTIGVGWIVFPHGEDGASRSPRVSASSHVGRVMHPTRSGKVDRREPWNVASLPRPTSRNRESPAATAANRSNQMSSACNSTSDGVARSLPGGRARTRIRQPTASRYS